MATIGFVFLADTRQDSPSSPESTAPQVPGPTAVVATGTLNVRDGSSLDAAVIDTVAEGDRLEVVGEDRDGFTPVRYGSGVAWVATEYLDVGEAPGVLASMWREGLRPQAAVAAPARADIVNTEVEDEPVEPDSSHPETVSETIEPVNGDGPAPSAEPAGEMEAAGPPDAVVPDPGSEPDDSVLEDESVASEKEGVAEDPEEATPPGEQWIEVDRSSGIVTLHEGETVVATYQGKIGKDPSADGFYSTAIGTFHVYSMNKELAPTSFAEGVYLTDFVGFDPVRSNGFHSPVRDASGNLQPFQNAKTLGCVRLDADAAVAVFDFAFIGMRVEIHD